MKVNGNSPGQPARFGTTRWSVVLQASGPNSDESQSALNELFTIYWYPLYAFTRRQGNSEHDAMDLTQGFLAQLVSGDGLSSVSPERGRFRFFLLASLKNFIANERRAANTQRRGGQVTILSLTSSAFEARYECEPRDEITPEMLFDRSWVEALLARVGDRLAIDYARAGKEHLYRLLEPHMAKSEDARPRTEIARELNMTPAAIAMSLLRMRKRFGELLREEIAATVDDPNDVEDELRQLMVIISRGD